MYRAETRSHGQTFSDKRNFLSLCKATLHQIQKLLSQKRNHGHTGSPYKFFYGVALERNTGPEFTKIKGNTDEKYTQAKPLPQEQIGHHTAAGMAAGLDMETLVGGSLERPGTVIPP